MHGQQSAYAVLVERYKGYVFSLVIRYINNRETAEELAQDVFVKAYRFLPDFKGDCKFSTWLYTIVNSTCLSHIRKAKEPTQPLEETQMISIAGSTSEKPTSRIEQDTTSKLLAAAMDSLPADDARVLTLFYLNEQTVEEIGTITGLTTANVKVRLFRARQRLKEVIQTQYRELN